MPPRHTVDKATSSRTTADRAMSSVPERVLAKRSRLPQRSSLTLNNLPCRWWYSQLIAQLSLRSTYPHAGYQLSKESL